MSATMTIEEVDVQVCEDQRAFDEVPLISVVIALYNAESYFHATIAALSRQTISRNKLEFIVVDDGSTDGSLALARAWARRDSRVVVATKQNRGIAHTRKVAHALARGEWLTAVDPDDIIAPEYFSEVEKMMSVDKDNEVALYSTRVYITNDTTGRFTDTHPLGAKFRKGNRFVALSADSSAIQIGATCFLRTAVLAEHNIDFDVRVKPTFEDGHVVGRYLCHFEDPIVGLVATAPYYYRKRADTSSAVQSSWANNDKYDAQLRYGYIDMLRYAKEQKGFIPDWMASIVLYDMMWYFKEYQRYGSVNRWLSDEQKQRFIKLCGEIFSYLSVRQLDELRINQPRWVLKETLLLGFGLVSEKARLYQCSRDVKNRREYLLLLGPQAKTVTTFVRGLECDVELLGVTEHELFGSLLMRECLIRVPDSDFAVRVDGIPLPVRRIEKPTHEVWEHPQAKKLTEKARPLSLQKTDWEKRKNRIDVMAAITGSGVTSMLLSKGVGAATRKMMSKINPAPHEKVLLKQEVERIERHQSGRYENAWLIFDRPNKADDNGEHLYRYIAQNRPDINVFFLLNHDSSDWKRLEEAGFRLIDFQSPERIVAAKHAAVVASSDAVAECINLIPQDLGKRTYKFVFLQHGISLNDISLWLRDKTIDLIICGLIPEYEAFAWKDSPYQFTVKGLALTGLARYDVLLQRALNKRDHDTSASRSLTLTVMPTWRRNLKDALDSAQTPDEQRMKLHESDFLNTWFGVLGSEKLAAKVSAGDLRVRFVAHPNLVPFLDILPIPEHVETVLPDEQSFQDLLIETDLFLTDYSSVAFDAAYAGRSVAYYQFDRELMSQGVHSWVPGYFDWPSMGMGPVFDDLPSIEEWVNKSIASGGEVSPIYRERVVNFFAYVDTNNRERIVEAMEALLADDLDALQPKMLRDGQPPTLAQYAHSSIKPSQDGLLGQVKKGARSE